MRAPAQPFFSALSGLGINKFGGSMLRGNPREARPIAVKRPMHLVMKSSLATGHRSLLAPAHARRIDRAVMRLAAAQGVRVHRFSNNGNHLHLIVRPRSREAF